MNLRMTIEAAPGEQKGRPPARASRQRSVGARHRGMSGHRMALLAQKRSILFQPGLVDRAVRVVAQGAVLGRRRMLHRNGPRFSA